MEFLEGQRVTEKGFLVARQFVAYQGDRLDCLFCPVEFLVRVLALALVAGS